ncbi:MAG: DNA helicase UvrD [Candidatus Aenigmarchaeota archaeon]|nr:DNA helicase UvrD [Candidatus Aenigmarchaeota archaeon]NIP39948.1 DNA helicase UvrD [Candidatus Aenigmarchaeota archaeon]NIQ17667.1 DNA helicase UvrD [Candidatus Aenigmarchaeota archaeon]NIS72855.1 DNA helicase UvrD [Candidatus Aenigmarchaeota archaeon]
MKIFSDLHIHSRFSRATSKELNIENLVKYAKMKGLNLLGTGDFTHSLWLKELKEDLREDGSGILKSKGGFSFLLSAEVSNIYTQDNRQRRIHNVILAKDFETVEQINDWLSKKGRLDYDGRPIFGFTCTELVENIVGISKDCMIIPAHIWTPWFSLFGSKSGFDRIEECFQDQTKNIFALETGLSSDPEMNWRLSSLDRYALVSFSDLHSFWPWRIGREATVFEMKELTYDNLVKSIRTKEGLVETIEVDPSYGKYHHDGHRGCGVSLSPEEARNSNNLCPVCKRPLTIGVLHRVEELADRDKGFVPKDSKPFRSLIPLSEIISIVLGSPVNSRRVWEEYNKLVNAFGSEFNVLMEAGREQLINISNERMVDLILNARSRNIRINAGYDGVYGELVMKEDETEGLEKPQKTLKDFS